VIACSVCANGAECAYRHVRASDAAVVCSDFLRGYCEQGVVREPVVCCDACVSLTR
jgi:hypothetical protein